MRAPSQRFDLALVDGDLKAEINRLAAPGATRLDNAKHGAVELADPDGDEFCLVYG